MMFAINRLLAIRWNCLHIIGHGWGIFQNRGTDKGLLDVIEDARSVKATPKRRDNTLKKEDFEYTYWACHQRIGLDLCGKRILRSRHLAMFCIL